MTTINDTNDSAEDTPEARAYRRVCDEAHALQAGCGLNELLAAVRVYGDFMRMAGAASAAVAPAPAAGPAPAETMGTLRITHRPTGPEWAFEPTERALQLAPGDYLVFAGGSAPAADDDEDDGITEEQWTREVERVMEAFGETQEDAAAIALELWRAQDIHSGEIGEPIEEALQWLEERPETPVQRDAKRYSAVRDFPWMVHYDHTDGPDSIQINLACVGDRAARPADTAAELDRMADHALARADMEIPS